ncbi:MAG: hypothetical protein JXR96_29485, partial [Deltaproteobacteria bacterium]|nr:hypothetical protein [Deltaproteobacteria bacterium]
MPRFEIWMPKSPKVPMDLRLRLEAESWIDALRTGLAKAGEGGPAAENVLCDIKEDNSIHVTDTASGRVFRIMEIEIDATAEQVVTQPPPAAEEPADDSATLPEMPAARDEVITQPSMPAVQAPAQVPPAQVPPKPEPAPARVSEPAPVQMPAAQAPAARVQPAQV